MQKRLLDLLFLFLLFNLKGNSQTNDSLLNLTNTKKHFSNTKYSFTFKGEYIHQGNNYVTVGLGYLNPHVIDGGPCNSFVLGAEGFSASTDISVSGQPFHIIPKISYEAAFMLIGAKLNLEMPTDFKSNTFIFCPEIGLTLVGFVYVYYGYNFMDKPLFDISRNKLTVGFNLQKTRFWDK
jgi:hypothetical protein